MTLFQYSRYYVIYTPTVFVWDRKQYVKLSVFNAAVCVSDYGDCPNKPCLNGGKCGMRTSNEYFCTCPVHFVGKYCESKQIDLTPILVIPIVIGLLIVALALLWCLIGVFRHPVTQVCRWRHCDVCVEIPFSPWASSWTDLVCASPSHWNSGTTVLFANHNMYEDAKVSEPSKTLARFG